MIDMALRVSTKKKKRFVCFYVFRSLPFRLEIDMYVLKHKEGGWGRRLRPPGGVPHSSTTAGMKAGMITDDIKSFPRRAI